MRLLWARRDKFDPHALAWVAMLSDVLVINWGVHYVDDASAQWQLDIGLSAIKAAWRGRAREDVFWRASLAAHEHCPREGESVGDTANVPNGSSATITQRWNAQEVLEQDRSLNWPAIEGFGGRVLHVETLTLPRSDGHRVDGPGRWVDCLHFCLPGVPDAWGQLLITTLDDDHRDKSSTLSSTTEQPTLLHE